MLKFDPMTPIAAVVALPNFNEDRMEALQKALAEKEGKLPMTVISPNNEEIASLDAEIEVIDIDAGIAAFSEGVKYDIGLTAVLDKYTLDEFTAGAMGLATADLGPGTTEYVDVAVLLNFTYSLDNGIETEDERSSIYVIFATYSEDGKEPEETNYFAILLFDQLTLSYDAVSKSIDLHDDEEELPSEVVEFATQFALFKLDIKEGVECDTATVIGYALDETSEKITMYEQVIAIRDNLLFEHSSNLSKIYQAVVKHYPRTTIDQITKYASGATLPLLDSMDLPAEDDDHEEVSIVIVHEFQTKGGVSTEAINDAAYTHLGLAFLSEDGIGFNNLDADVLELRKVLDGVESKDEVFVGDMSVNIDAPEWVLTLLIPFIRKKMNQYPDIGSEGINYNMIDEFVAYVNEAG